MNNKLSKLFQLLCIIFGNIILAFGIASFSIPNQFLVGGSTGTARVFEYFFSIPISLSIAIVNTVMFLIGLYFLGKKFALTTLISTFLFPTLLNMFLNIEGLAHLTDDKLLSAIFAGVLLGVGLGIVLRVGASTGGFDIPPLILNHKFKIPVAVSMYAFDAVILIAQIYFSQTEEVLYGILSVLLSSIVLNKVLVSGSGHVEAFIISNKFAEINCMLQTKLDKGSTLVPVQTGHTGADLKAIICVLPARELSAFNSEVLAIDSVAFIIISSARDVRGKGFSLERSF